MNSIQSIAAQINSQLRVFVTDNSMQVIEAKVRTVSDQLIDLVPSTTSQATNTFSLANLPAGVYTLDVITQKGNARAAYEGILVIGQQPTTIINETINRETNENGDLIIILPPDDGPPTPGADEDEGEPGGDEGGDGGDEGSAE